MIVGRLTAIAPTFMGRSNPKRASMRNFELTQDTAYVVQRKVSQANQTADQANSRFGLGPAPGVPLRRESGMQPEKSGYHSVLSQVESGSKAVIASASFVVL